MLSKITIFFHMVKTTRLSNVTVFILDHYVFTSSAMWSLLTDSGVRGNIYTFNGVLKLDTHCHKIIHDHNQSALYAFKR
ncbi:MAG: hypothetical protein GPOALKHO_000055 [Sodalis sp.]|nr:MAG: hypothetical protein GPOALKHO_000055 [Sodalis sp.]